MLSGIEIPFFSNLLGKAVLSGAELNRSNLSGSAMGGAAFERADLTEADLSDSDLAQTNFGGALLISVFAARSSFARAVLCSARLDRGNFEDVCFLKSDLGRCSLAGTFLSRADLTGANLVHADVTAAFLVDAIMVGATRQWNENLGCADFSNAILSLVPGMDRPTAPSSRARQLHSVSIESPVLLPAPPLPAQPPPVASPVLPPAVMEHPLFAPRPGSPFADKLKQALAGGMPPAK